MNKLIPLTLAALGLATPASAQITAFQHIILVIQENRTPDNCSRGCATTTTPDACSTKPGPGQYNIQTTGWFDKTSPTGTTNPSNLPFGVSYDLWHNHSRFRRKCDLKNRRLRDGWGRARGCKPELSPAQPKAAYGYVDNSKGVLQPYLDLVMPMVGETICSRPTRGQLTRRINSCSERRPLRRRTTTTRHFRSFDGRRYRMCVAENNQSVSDQS